MSNISRREVMALGAGSLESCASPSSACFGNTAQPASPIPVHGPKAILLKSPVIIRLRAMPVLPQDQWVNAVMVKPYVRGLGSNLLDREQLKYVWIDTNWRPQ
jgi:hypothetical protein